MKKDRSILNILIVILLLMNNYEYVFSTPTLYKRNPEDIYERDLVPVSSTVIPLTVLEVSYGLGGKPSEEYKEAYIKKLLKKDKDAKIKNDLHLLKPSTLIRSK